MGFHVACRGHENNCECQTVSARIQLCSTEFFFVHTHGLQRVWICNCRHGCRHGELPGAPHSLFELGDHNIWRKCPSPCPQTKTLAVGLPCSLTHVLFLSPSPCFLPLPLGLTFALDDSVNFHVVRSSVSRFSSSAK